MIKRLQTIFFFATLLSATSSWSQSTTCPWVNAGPDQTICAPNCATLTATYLTTSATTTYTISTPPYAPDPFTAGTAVAVGDDQWSVVVPIGFTFCYMGTPYTQCIIGSNGDFSFNTANATFYNTWPISNAMPNTNPPDLENSIMGPWQDLYPPSSGTIKYQVYGLAPCRRFVISWNNVAMYSCTGNKAYQQICLYETTNIIDNYIQAKPTCASWNGGYAIQCIENAAGNTAFVVPGRNWPTVWTVTNDAKRYTPSGAPTSALTWYDGSMTSIGNTATVVPCPTATTTYTASVVYTNCDGTTVTASDQVVVNVSTLAVTMSAPANICLGGNTSLSATATGATTWSWVPTTNLSCTTCCCPTANPTVTTTYTCYVSNGVCQGTGTVTVTVTPMAVANAGPDVTVCFGGNVQLNASGGVTYSWAPATGLSNPNIANPVCTPTATTTYTVYVTTASGCQGNDQITVTLNPAITLNTAGFNTTCSLNCNGQAICIPSGGTGPYTFLWTPGNGTGASITGLCAGIYSVVVTDAFGCTGTDTANVNSPSTMVLTTTPTNASCGQPTGQACVVVTGGVGPYQYMWTPSGQTTACATGIPAGSYTIDITDFNNCTAQAVVIVGNNSGVTASIQAHTNVTCFNACDGTANVSVTGGTAPFTYNWTPSGGTNSNATGLCAGTYTCTVLDANNCTDTAVVVITQPAQVVVTPSAAVTICTGGCTTITASAVGGNGIYTYVWMPGNLSGSSVQVCPLVTTQYTVVANDGNNCVSSPQTLIVTVRPPITVNGAGATSVCPGGCTNITATAVGGTGGPYTYVWTPGNLSGSSVSVCPVANTIYTVTVSDGCSPTVTDTVTVNVLPSPVVTFTVDNNAGCAPLCVNFTNTSLNTVAWAWTFSGGNPATSNQQNPGNVCFLTAGSYNVSLQVTSASGCTATLTNNNMITVHPNPIANFSASPQPTTTLNGTITFTDLSTNASNWTWSFDQNDITATSSQQNPLYTYTDSGTYVVVLQVSNQWGCTDADTQTVVIYPDYTFYAPNAFTPNDDQLNDYFVPKTMYADPNNYALYIFDRWGNLIYHTNDMSKGWNGHANDGNDIAQEDVYIWKVITKDNLSFKHEYTGHVSLVK